METITTTDTKNADITVAVAIDLKSAAILAISVFIAITGALLIYKKL